MPASLDQIRNVGYRTIGTEDEALRKVSSEQAPSRIIEHGTDRDRVGFAGGGAGRLAGHGASRQADDGRGTEEMDAAPHSGRPAGPAGLMDGRHPHTGGTTPCA